MSHPLIINVRQQLHWQQRLFSDASTAMLWGLWLWLWRPVLSTLNWLAGMGAGMQPTLLKLMLPASVEGGVVALVGTSGTLLLWNLLPARRAAAQPGPDLAAYAQHFQLPVQAIEAGRESRICVVHHDAQGRILRIEPRPAANGPH